MAPGHTDIPATNLSVECVPQLGSDEEILPLADALLDAFLDGLANLCGCCRVKRGKCSNQGMLDLPLSHCRNRRRRRCGEFPS